MWNWLEAVRGGVGEGPSYNTRWRYYAEAHAQRYVGIKHSFLNATRLFACLIGAEVGEECEELFQLFCGFAVRSLSSHYRHLTRFLRVVV